MRGVRAMPGSIRFQAAIMMQVRRKGDTDLITEPSGEED